MLTRILFNPGNGFFVEHNISNSNRTYWKNDNVNSTERNKRTASIAILAVLALTAFLTLVPVRTLAVELGRKYIDLRVRTLTVDYETMESHHFVLKYTHEGAEIWADEVLDQFEKSYSFLSENLDFEPAGKTTVVLFPDEDSFRKAFSYAGKSPMGMYYAGTIGILLPDLWIGGEASAAEKLERFRSEGPVVHELTHLFADQLSGGNIPLWFNEGIALYYENKLTGFEWGRGLKEKAAEISLARLTRDFAGVDVNLAYRRSFDAVDKTAKAYGETQLKGILLRLAKGEDLLDMLGEMGIF